MSKVSIRFFNDKEVRAVWNEQESKWFFSVLDIVGVLNNQEDYEKNRNYWKYLKAKLKKEGNQLGSVTTQLKLTAPDGKKRLSNVMDYNQVIELAKNFPNTKSTKFIEWFTYSDETIEKMSEETFDDIVNKYVEMNIAHPFREGNGRTTRIWLDLMLKKQLKKCIDWSLINKNTYLLAMEKSVVDSTEIKILLKNALTDKINDREMFMKGIDYSYYYEEIDNNV